MKYKWIFCCGMRRGGSTLQYHIVQDICEPRDAISVGWITWQTFDGEIHALYKDKPTTQIVKCHAHFPTLTKTAGLEFNNGNACAIYCYRDMRDVIASQLKLIARGPWEPFDDQAVEAEVKSILNEYNLWTQTKPCLISRYETLTLDIAGEANRIAEFLEIKLADGEAEAIAENRTIEKQKKRQGVKGQNHYSLLWKWHISNGAIGKWQHELSDRHKSIVQLTAGPWLKDRGYN